MREQENLRPLESVILKLQEEGLSNDEIGERIRKKPETVARFLDMIEHKADVPEQVSSEPLEKRPVERVVDRLRTEGESYEQIGNRLNRGEGYVRRVESYSEIKEQL